ncbi:MAG: type II secretion system F family protein [Thermoguttaceae bacterium]
MSPMLVALAAFVGVAALVGAVALMLREKPAARLEDRLDLFTGAHAPAAKGGPLKEARILAQPLEEGPGVLKDLLSRFGDIDRLFRQADTPLTLPRLLVICGALGVAGMALGIFVKINPLLWPVAGLLTASLPILWLVWRRRRRLKAFAVQLPDALDMLARALRAGQSLSAGIGMVATEIGPPLGTEFGRVFEEQNLGISWEESLNALTDRVPNVDLKFFATAVILQRQTGGDLAEILDKISYLIRQRFQIWGQVQALTGEGRLSGIVLMALPVVLFLAVYRLNPDYVMVLFTDPLGKKMLGVAVFLQILGALAIRKIVSIKV